MTNCFNFNDFDLNSLQARPSVKSLALFLCYGSFTLKININFCIRVRIKDRYCAHGNGTYSLRLRFCVFLPLLLLFSKTQTQMLTLNVNGSVVNIFVFLDSY